MDFKKQRASKKPEEMISFFKTVWKEDFHRLLRLPRVFMREYGSVFPRKVKIRSNGKTWDVKVKAIDDALFCFSKGWDVFAKDVGLKLGEFLVFVLDNNDGYTLDVSVFGTNGCIKRFPWSHDDDDDSDEDEDEDEDVEDGDDDDGSCGFRLIDPRYYEFVLKPYNKSRLTLRRKFVRAAGLKGKDRVELVGEHHKLCVGLDNTHRDKDRIDLNRGWTDFQKMNNLVFGKKYSFEFKRDENVIHVKQVN